MNTFYSKKFRFPSTKVVFSTAASVAATALVVRQFTKDFIPTELRQYFRTQIHCVLATYFNEVTIVIEEFDGIKNNRLFYAAEAYVGSISSPDITTYRAVLPEKEKQIGFSLGENEEIIDKFRGINIRWVLATDRSRRMNFRHSDEFGSTTTSELKSLRLTFHKKHKNKVMDEYLPYVLERSEALKQTKKTLKLHTLKNERSHGSMANLWQSVNLDHPAKFETLAMDDEMKNMIVDDLDRFVKRRELYRKVGKAWKRGYLLFGPPGTGKSSLIAAMANHLNFDIYDLELTNHMSNSDLRKLVVSTANRSILVVEDIDASIDLTHERRRNKEGDMPPRRQMYPYAQPEPKVTLSGLLNFIDGLWSSCGDERIIIFTTNHKERLDPALLRPGRMDVHIHMSYCTPCGFRLLASNYLGTTEHELMFEVEQLIASSEVTPAEVGEQLLKNDDPQLALEGLIKFLELKKETKSPDQLKELIKIAEELPSEICEDILKKDEAANALRFLIGFIEKESLGSMVPESEQEKD